MSTEANQLSQNNKTIIEAVKKLNKYVCAYPSRSNNVSDALTSVGCRKMNKLFELAESAETDRDAEAVSEAFRSMMKTINQYVSRALAVQDALCTRGNNILSDLQMLTEIKPVNTAKQSVQTTILGVTPEQMNLAKSLLAYSEMPLNSKEIIVEVTEDDFDTVSESIAGIELGYNILHIQ